MLVASCIACTIAPERMNPHTFNIAKQFAYWDGSAWIVHAGPRPNLKAYCPGDEQLTVAVQLSTWFDQVGLKCKGFDFKNKQKHGRDELTVCGVTFA